MQRLQLPGGVYLSQDIYGMDRNRTEDTDGGNGSGVLGESPGVEKDPDDDGMKMTLDADAVECVICLTDPREVAVYPCRHMCLCTGCAEVLPSQGNKCPICRRKAIMLVCICGPKEPGEEEEKAGL